MVCSGTNAWDSSHDSREKVSADQPYKTKNSARNQLLYPFRNPFTTSLQYMWILHKHIFVNRKYPDIIQIIRWILRKFSSREINTLVYTIVHIIY